MLSLSIHWSHEIIHLHVCNVNIITNFDAIANLSDEMPSWSNRCLLAVAQKCGICCCHHLLLFADDQEISLPSDTG